MGDLAQASKIAVTLGNSFFESWASVKREGSPPISTSSFAQPAALTWGTSPRNAVKGPGRDNWNLSLYKTFQFAVKVHLLWIGVGTEEPERMRTGLQRLHTSLLEPNIRHVSHDSPGTDHEWQTWRRDLKDFAPRLF